MHDEYSIKCIDQNKEYNIMPIYKFNDLTNEIEIDTKQANYIDTYLGEFYPGG